MASCKNKQQVGGGETGKILKTKTSNDRVFLPNLYIYMVCAGSNDFLGGKSGKQRNFFVFVYWFA